MSALEAQSLSLSVETSSKLRGWVKVSIKSLVFYPDFTSCDYSFTRDKVDHLKDVINREGCDRLSPNHFIPGDISEEAFDASLTCSNLSCEQIQNKADPLRLFFPEGTFVRCARGRNRVKALKELRKTDLWWTIQLHVGECI